MGELLQAARARLRGAGLRRCGRSGTARRCPHPALQAGLGAGDARRDPLPIPRATRTSPSPRSCTRGSRGSSAATSCPTPMETNLYHLTAEERRERGIVSLPETLGEAIDEFAASDLMRRAFGDHIFDSYVAEAPGMGRVPRAAHPVGARPLPERAVATRGMGGSTRARSARPITSRRCQPARSTPPARGGGGARGSPKRTASASGSLGGGAVHRALDSCPTMRPARVGDEIARLSRRRSRARALTDRDLFSVCEGIPSCCGKNFVRPGSESSDCARSFAAIASQAAATAASQSSPTTPPRAPPDTRSTGRRREGAAAGSIRHSAIPRPRDREHDEAGRSAAGEADRRSHDLDPACAVR